MKMKCLKSHREAISLLMYHQVTSMRNMYIISFGAVILVPLLSLISEKFDTYTFDSYINIFMDRIQCWAPFFIAIISWVFYFIFDLLRKKWKYRVDDRMMILPCGRMDVILSQFFVILGTFLLLYLVQTFVYIAGYFIYVHQVPKANISNGLFLAVLQTAYTKFFLPLHMTDITRLYLFTIWFSLLIVYYGHFAKYIKKGILIHILTTVFLLAVISILLLFFIQSMSTFNSLYIYILNFFSGFGYAIYILIGSVIIVYNMRRLMKKRYL